MADISLLLLLALMFYATLGLHLFNRQQVPGYSPHDDNFNDWLNSVLGACAGNSTGVEHAAACARSVRHRMICHSCPLLSMPAAMFVLSTTENYPNVANQAYRHRPVVAAIFFVSALFVILWLLLPLILATVYDHYKVRRAASATPVMHGWCRCAMRLCRSHLHPPIPHSAPSGLLVLQDVHARMVRAKRVKQYVSLVFAYQVSTPLALPVGCMLLHGAPRPPLPDASQSPPVTAVATLAGPAGRRRPRDGPPYLHAAGAAPPPTG